MWLIVSKFVVPKNFSGVTIFPFIFTRAHSWAKNKTFVTHEKIHLRQQLELLVVMFFLWYGVEFLIRSIQYRNFHQAYRNISFEREAYANENNFNYLQKRPFLTFLRYL